MEAWLDDGVSQLVAKLKTSGEFENTLFAFVIDNQDLGAHWERIFSGPREGILKLKVLPLPNSLSAQMRPP